jgi:hypothetical protein
MNEKLGRWSWAVPVLLILVPGNQYSHLSLHTAMPTEQFKGMAYSPFREGQSIKLRRLWQ